MIISQSSGSQYCNNLTDEKGGREMSKDLSHSSGIHLSKLTRKTRVLIVDTSILMYDAHAVETFEDNWVVLGIKTIEELDKLKDSDSQRKSLAAKTAIRVLSEYEARGNLKYGVPVNDGMLFVDDDGEDWEDENSKVMIKKNDANTIIAIANGWRKKLKECEGQYSGTKPRVAIVSKNMSLRIKANAYGICEEDYEHDRDILTMKDLYTGLIQIDLKEEEQSLLYDLTRDPKANRNSGILAVKQLPKSLYEKEILSNQFIRFVTEKGQIAYGRYKTDAEEIVYVPFNKPEKERSKILPLNPEQACADNLLYDKDVLLMTLVGEAGTGKTILCLNAGLDQVINSHRYEKMIIFRPLIEVGRELGYLPGDRAAKMAPWIAPIEEALRRIYSLTHKDVNPREALAEMIATGQIEIRPINYERGDSIHNAFIIIEEVQNLKPSEVKLLITRVAAGSKVVLNGDLTQIDDPFLDFRSNGLTQVVQRFKGRRLGSEGTVGHITLTKSERSSVAEIAAKILS